MEDAKNAKKEEYYEGKEVKHKPEKKKEEYYSVRKLRARNSHRRRA